MLRQILAPSPVSSLTLTVWARHICQAWRSQSVSALVPLAKVCVSKWVLTHRHFIRNFKPARPEGGCHACVAGRGIPQMSIQRIGSLCLESPEGAAGSLREMAHPLTIPAHSCPSSIFQGQTKCLWRYSPLGLRAIKCHSDARKTTLYMTLERHELMLVKIQMIWSKRHLSVHCFQDTDRVKELSAKIRYLSKTAHSYRTLLSPDSDNVAHLE